MARQVRTRTSTKVEPFCRRLDSNHERVALRLPLTSRLANFVFTHVKKMQLQFSLPLLLSQSYFTLLLALLIVSSVLAAAQGTKLVKVRTERESIAGDFFSLFLRDRISRQRVKNALHRVPPPPILPGCISVMPAPRLDFEARSRVSFGLKQSKNWRGRRACAPSKTALGEFEGSQER